MRTRAAGEPNQASATGAGLILEEGASCRHSQSPAPRHRMARVRRASRGKSLRPSSPASSSATRLASSKKCPTFRPHGRLATASASVSSKASGGSAGFRARAAVRATRGRAKRPRPGRSQPACDRNCGRGKQPCAWLRRSAGPGGLTQRAPFGWSAGRRRSDQALRATRLMRCPPSPNRRVRGVPAGAGSARDGRRRARQAISDAGKGRRVADALALGGEHPCGEPGQGRSSSSSGGRRSQSSSNSPPCPAANLGQHQAAARERDLPGDVARGVGAAMRPQAGEIVVALALAAATRSGRRRHRQGRGGGSVSGWAAPGTRRPG